MLEYSRLAQIDPSRVYGKVSTLKVRNLGAEILAMAVEDYKTGDSDEYESARRFLYPCTEHDKDRFEWAASMLEEMDPVMLRESLDLMRPEWDAARRVQ